MYLELGNGKKEIVLLNADKSNDITVMLSRIFQTYQTMLASRYAILTKITHHYKLIFTDDVQTYHGCRIDISTRPCGIYIGTAAYLNQIGQTLFVSTGLKIHYQDIKSEHVEIGIGNMDACTHGYVIIKDALLQLLDRGM